MLVVRFDRGRHRGFTAKVGGGCITGAVDRACQEHGLALSPAGSPQPASPASRSAADRRARAAFRLCRRQPARGRTGDRRRGADHGKPRLPFRAVLACAGGGNFGVVTSLTFRAHPMEPVVTGGLILYDGERGKEVLKHARTVMETAPEHLGLFMFYVYAPDDPSIPEELRTGCVRPGGQPHRPSRHRREGSCPAARVRASGRRLRRGDHLGRSEQLAGRPARLPAT